MVLGFYAGGSVDRSADVVAHAACRAPRRSFVLPGTERSNGVRCDGSGRPCCTYDRCVVPLLVMERPRYLARREWPLAKWRWLFLSHAEPILSLCLARRVTGSRSRSTKTPRSSYCAALPLAEVVFACAGFRTTVVSEHRLPIIFGNFVASMRCEKFSIEGVRHVVRRTGEGLETSPASRPSPWLQGWLETTR